MTALRLYRALAVGWAALAAAGLVSSPRLSRAPQHELRQRLVG